MRRQYNGAAITLVVDVFQKPRKEYKMQYRWRRGFKDAYEIANAIYPYAKTKKKALKDIIDHYDHKETNRKNEDVVRRHTRASR
jgi:spore coat polysaccharide biosynthesis protein SpsF (cytidylyltransferase family)